MSEDNRPTNDQELTTDNLQSTSFEDINSPKPKRRKLDSRAIIEIVEVPFVAHADGTQTMPSDLSAEEFADDDGESHTFSIREFEIETDKTETEDVLKMKLDPNMDFTTLIRNMNAGFVNSAKSFRKTITQHVKNRCNLMESTLAKCTNKHILTDLTTHLTSLQVNLPISDFYIFKLFDEEVSQNEEKIKALKTIMTVITRQSSTAKEALMKILSQIMGKSVQQRYSAGGKGNDKASFKDTFIYSTMRDVILELNQEACESQILTHLSNWLSHAGDREGGRKERKSAADLKA